MTKEDVEDVTDMVNFMKANHVLRFRDGAIEIELSPMAFPSVAVPDGFREIDPSELLKDPLANPASEDEARFWHAGGSGLTDTQGNPVAEPLTGEDLGGMG